ncbi:MAG: hypothetical protein K2Q33_00755 [Gammaproteobacteria bacterium]|nr:hypothetical protein [Gammaproteobacteria bacterium]
MPSSPKTIPLIRDLQGKIYIQRQRIQILEACIQQTQISLDDLLTKRATLSQDLTTAQTRIEDLKSASRKMSTILDQIQALPEEPAKKEAIRTCEIRIENYKNEITTTKYCIQGFNNQLNNLDSQIAKIKTNLHGNKALLESEKLTLAEAEHKLLCKEKIFDTFQNKHSAFFARKRLNDEQDANIPEGLKQSLSAEIIHPIPTLSESTDHANSFRRR